jgi:AcrR family transcriptional regulator
MTLAKRRTQAERTDLSDRRMLEAAVKLIVANGVEKSTLREVGENAGYSRGLAGYRFGNKAGLLEFIVRTIGEDWLRDLTRATEGLTGYAAMASAIDEHLKFCLDAPDRVRAFYILWFEAASPDSAVKRVVSGIHDRRRRDVAQWITRAVAEGAPEPEISADDIAGQFNTAIVGIVYHWLQHPEDSEGVAQLHENLKHTMKRLLEPPAA